MSQVAERANAVRPRVKSRRPLLLAVLVALCVAAGVVAVVSQRATADVARARELALRGVALRDVDRIGAQVLGLAAVRIHPDGLTRSMLTETLVSERHGTFTGTGTVPAVALSGDGRTALTVDREHGAVVWTLTPNGGPENDLDAVRSAALTSRDDPVSASALSSDGRTAVLGGRDGSLRLWDLAHRPPRAAKTVMEGGQGVARVALTPEGKTALVGHDGGRAVLWDLTDRSHPVRLSTLSGHTSRVRGVGLSADGRVAVTASDEAAFVWDLTDRAHPVRTGLAPRGSAALSADGRTAVVGGQVWDVTDRARPRRLAALPGIAAEVNDVALTANGDHVLTVEDSGVTTYWELKDRSRPARVATLKAPARQVDAGALSADGGIAVIGTPEWGASSWLLDGISGDPRRDLCGDRAFTSLRVTRKEWDSWAGGAEWPDRFGDGDVLDLCSG